MRSSTPRSLSGAIVIDTGTFADLREHPQTLVLDVALAEERPASMPDNSPWMPLHRSVPGAVWLPGAGNGNNDPAFEKVFKTEIETLTDHDLDRAIVTFCHPQCWASWNAAKRLIQLGYRRVYWYSEGLEGWQASHETRAAQEDPEWKKAMQPADSN